MKTQSSTILCEEQANLRIVESLEMQNLPENVQNMLSLASTPEEQDILLMSMLTAASACMPKLYFRYGPTGKKYYANLQCFILAAAASGKGIANLAREMVSVVDAAYPLMIAGDSTYPAWFKSLFMQHGCGYMHESEGSVITDIWKASAMNYNTALRKAAEHECIGRNRVLMSAEIAAPKFSMLLTGTFNQYKTLVPSVENGYFSRLLSVVIRGNNPFRKNYVTSIGQPSAIPTQVGVQLLRLFASTQDKEREWSLTESQKARLGSHLENEYKTLIELLGENFHSTVIRMAVQIERIALVLTALRHHVALAKETKFYCSDEDYHTAEVIGNKLLFHMAEAYRMIDGEAQEVVPDIQSIDPKKVLFEQIKAEYKLQELIDEAKAHGVSRSSAIRWNNEWIENGLVSKESHGEYKKIA